MLKWIDSWQLKATHDPKRPSPMNFATLMTPRQPQGHKEFGGGPHPGSRSFTMFFYIFHFFPHQLISVDQNLDPLDDGARQLETPDLSAGAESPWKP